MSDEKERAEQLLLLMEGLIDSNVALAQEVRELRKAILKVGAGNAAAGILKTLGVRLGGR